jgi:FRG domain
VKELTRVYGAHALDEWYRRLAVGGTRWKYLGDTTESSSDIAQRQPLVIHSARDLVKVLSFLNVMNKKLVLLYRGQTDDFPLLPSLERQHWFPPGGGKVDLELDRLHYWRQLTNVEKSVRDILMQTGVPRWRPFLSHPAALWAVIQHYEIWPTPLLDFTSSWRVAATFAFNFERQRRQAFLYVVGMHRVRSDLMDIGRLVPDDSAFAVRLSAVCPPDAQRPHLQDGFLVGHYPFNESIVVHPAFSDAAAILVARIVLVNRRHLSFWDADFPMLRRGSLLPDEHTDPLLRSLRRCASSKLDQTGLVWAGGEPSAAPPGERD